MASSMTSKEATTETELQFNSYFKFIRGYSELWKRPPSASRFIKGRVFFQTQLRVTQISKEEIEIKSLSLVSKEDAKRMSINVKFCLFDPSTERSRFNHGN